MSLVIRKFRKSVVNLWQSIINALIINALLNNNTSQNKHWPITIRLFWTVTPDQCSQRYFGRFWVYIGHNRANFEPFLVDFWRSRTHSGGTRPLPWVKTGQVVCPHIRFTLSPGNLNHLDPSKLTKLLFEHFWAILGNFGPFWAIFGPFGTNFGDV